MISNNEMILMKVIVILLWSNDINGIIINVVIIIM